MGNCKELLIYREGESKKESISSSFDMYESVYLGNTDEQNFVDYKDNVKITGFCSKLTCIIAFIICYYEDNVEYNNLDKIYDRFLKSCHYTWIKEWLLDEYCLHLELNKFKESGLFFRYNVFEELSLPFLYPDEFKQRLEEIVTSADITLEYICEDEYRECLYD